MKIKIKRVYDASEKEDGLRILVDRLWPRGVKKETAGIDLWMKEVAPSNTLRKEFGHDPAKWKEFKTKYQRELSANEAAVAQLMKEANRKTVTLLYAAKDVEHNQALLLQEYVTRKLTGRTDKYTSND
jgi:uncharacterized protein YeaO (DUF488 family)